MLALIVSISPQVTADRKRKRKVGEVQEVKETTAAAGAEDIIVLVDSGGSISMDFSSQKELISKANA